MCKEPLYRSSHYIHTHQWQGAFFMFTLVVRLWRHIVSNIFETCHFILIPIKIYFHGVKTTLFYMFISVPKMLFEKMASLNATILVEAMLNEDCNYKFLSSNNAPIRFQEAYNNDMEASWALPS
jgi:hypothetical protein